MTKPPPRGPFTEALAQVIRDEALVKVGVARTPEGVTNDHAADRKPYAVVYPMTGTRIIPTLGDPNATCMWMYQVTCVGWRHDQAQWLDDLVHDILVARDAGGNFVYDIDVPGLVVSNREAYDTGQAPSDGTLVAVQGEYVFAIERADANG